MGYDVNYYNTHKEKFKEYNERWRQKNLDKQRQKARDYYYAHREKMLEYNNNYYKEHKEQGKINNDNRVRKIKALQEEIQNQYGIRFNKDDTGKLLTAKNKSQETFEILLQEYLSSQLDLLYEKSQHIISAIEKIKCNKNKQG